MKPCTTRLVDASVDVFEPLSRARKVLTVSTNYSKKGLVVVSATGAAAFYTQTQIKYFYLCIQPGRTRFVFHHRRN